MAKIIEERVVLVLSRLVKNSDDDDHDHILDSEKLSTLQQAVEGLADDESVVVEIETE